MGPRDAYYGGRTNGLWLYYAVKPDEKIRYLDICSLYPYCMKYDRFPTGHPRVLTENFEPIDPYKKPYFGVVKAKILPPKKLYVPILPYRCQGKLMFPLCAACVAEQETVSCTHTPDERALVGSWCTPEIYAAIVGGYKILEVYEVWDYPQSEEYDPKKPNSGLFTSFINKWLKLKRESSGWPGWVMTEEDKLNFLRMFEKREGIQLDREPMDRLKPGEKNHGTYALSKLLQNSSYGKFGQRNNLRKSLYANCSEECHDGNVAKFLDVMFGPEFTVSSCVAMTDESVWLEYVNRGEFVESLPNTNPIIAAMVTTYARLHLYSYMVMLKDPRRILYHDTDSIIYVERSNDEKIPVGDYLGDMTSELDDDDYIVEFCTGGPKYYGYLTARGKSEFKVKGFSLCFDTLKTLNMKNLKKDVASFVNDFNTNVREINHRQIVKNKTRKVTTVYRKKQARVTYNKRIVCEDFSTVPFGYDRAFE